MSTWAVPMGDADPGRFLREAREQMLSMQHAAAAAEQPGAAAALREEIASSWRRSMAYGVRPERFDVPYDAGPVSDDILKHAAGPVADGIGDDLDGTGMSLLLADGQARIVDRRVPGRSLLSDLDRISLAPGFRYSEESVGTNAIAIALQQHGPALVTGSEHFADTLAAMACAAAPITDPRTGRILGALTLTCQQEAASPLMVPFVKRASRDIEQRLLDGGSVADRILLEHFLRARRRVKGPLVLVNERIIHTNTAAAAIVDPADRPLLWDWASRAVAGNKPAVSQLGLTSGQPVVLRARPIEHGGVLAGALLRLDPLTPAREAEREQASLRQPVSGWASLTGTERSVAAIIAEGATNKEAAARLYLSRHTIDFHLRQIFRKLGIASRVELTRHVVERTSAERSPR
jgi:DNA-binding CsgD family transcriptional regulator